MNFGEDVLHNGSGVVYGKDSGRCVAVFSDEQDAEQFCNLYSDQDGKQLISEKAISYLYREWPDAYSEFCKRV